MRSFIAVVGMAAAVAAQTPGFHAINLPGKYEDVPACTTYMVKWTPSSTAAYAGPVTFGLIGGATPQTLVPIGSNFGSVLGSAGEYAWDVPCDAGADAIYGLKIFLASDSSIYQYSMPFHIIANGGSTTSSETATSTTETNISEPTAHGSHNSTTTTMTTMATSVTTSSTNSTIITHKPTGTSTTVTSFTTEAGSTATSPATSPATTTPATAGASRALSGSFAILAVAAAFFSL